MIEVTYIDHMGTDLSVVNAARVSFGKNSEWDYIDWRDTDDYARKKILSEGDTKLIKYLAKHKHMSPFGHAFASFHVKAPIFVARQLVKHKFLRWNEISRRYVDSEPEIYYPTDDVWRGKSEDKKQGSFGEVDLKKDTLPIISERLQQNSYQACILEDLIEGNEWQLKLYKDMIKAGIAPEQARMVLPQSTMTEWYWSGSLDAFADMCNLRLMTDTQYETQLVAQQIDQIMLGLFPVSWEALVYGDDE
jgi:thymidylate synthase (FAD)